jgi:hypothetical protein
MPARRELARKLLCFGGAVKPLKRFQAKWTPVRRPEAL